MADQNTSLPVRTETAGDVIVKLSDKTIVSQQLAISAAGEASIAQATAANLKAQVHLFDEAGAAYAAGNPLATETIVSGAAIDPRSIRALTSSDVVRANIFDEAGVAFSTGNPMPVFVTNTSGAGTELNHYQTNAAIAAAATSNHDYTAVGSSLLLNRVLASASGKMKIEVQIDPDGVSGYSTLCVNFNSTSEPNMAPEFAPVEIIVGGKIRVIRTNKDNQAQDLYSTLVGVYL